MRGSDNVSQIHLEAGPNDSSCVDGAFEAMAAAGALCPWLARRPLRVLVVSARVVVEGLKSHMVAHGCCMGGFFGCSVDGRYGN